MSEIREAQKEWKGARPVVPIRFERTLEEQAEWMEQLKRDEEHRERQRHSFRARLWRWFRE